MGGGWKTVSFDWLQSKLTHKQAAGMARCTVCRAWLGCKLPVWEFSGQEWALLRWRT